MGQGRGIKRFAGALIAALGMVLAIGAGTALATATATKAEWYTGASEGSVSELSGEQALTASIAENPTVGKHFRMTTMIGTKPLTIEANGVSCSKCVMSNKITGASGPGAIARGQLVFSEALVTSPLHCLVTGGSIATNVSFFEADFMEGETWLTRAYQEVGENSFSFSLEDKGGITCELAGTYTVQNFNFGAFENKTGTFRTEQRLNFSPQISEAAVKNAWWIKGTGAPFKVTGSLLLKAGGSYFGAK
jgi:hypothetical protein